MVCKAVLIPGARGWPKAIDLMAQGIACMSLVWVLQFKNQQHDIAYATPTPVWAGHRHRLNQRQAAACLMRRSVQAKLAVRRPQRGR